MRVRVYVRTVRDAIGISGVVLEEGMAGYWNVKPTTRWLSLVVPGISRGIAFRMGRSLRELQGWPDPSVESPARAGRQHWRWLRAAPMDGRVARLGRFVAVMRSFLLLHVRRSLLRSPSARPARYPQTLAGRPGVGTTERLERKKSTELFDVPAGLIRVRIDSTFSTR